MSIGPHREGRSSMPRIVSAAARAPGERSWCQNARHMTPPQRAAGILLHPTSLPGAHGCGDLGPTADAFLEWCEAAGQTLWQVLPLGPTGYGNSPYGALSAFAGNPLLIAPEELLAD